MSVFNSNGPELVFNEDILLSTFPFTEKLNTCTYHVAKIQIFERLTYPIFGHYIL
ncbi:DUF3370 family protein [Cyanobacterium sp. uoEpiScrs1]|uniref:DUF3370 family protein n=1 Tax=Cyanobacterium sp. uoEpiScrs1 TaxID=2976343 RepID=UPI003A5CE7D3